MFELTFPCDGRVARARVSKAILTSGQLTTCLVQLERPASALIAGDQSRPTAVAALRDLLQGHDQAGPALSDMAPGNAMVVVLLPELALASPDWDSVDSFVRSSPRPVILITGFGFSPAQAIIDWQAVEAGDTFRHFAWPGDYHVSTIMPVNGGWCWVHFPGEQTHCVLFLKKTQEQSIEAAEFADAQPGPTILELEFDDVDLFPLICSDILRLPQNDPGCALDLVQTSIATRPAAPNRPALILGSLLQSQFNPNWQIAIDTAVNTALAGRKSAIALCNIAVAKAEAEEDADRWRSLSGVYGRFADLPKGQPQLKLARAFEVAAVSGAVVRTGCACATVGPINWRLVQPTSRYLWQGKILGTIGAEGLAPPLTRGAEIAATELIRFLRRFPPGPDPAPRLIEGLAAIEVQAESAQEPNADRIIQSVLHGVDDKQQSDPDTLHRAETRVALKAGLHALATLKSVEGVDWQADPALTGQLRTAQANVLIWRSPDEAGKTMARKLALWRTNPAPHPPLVVFGAGPDTPLPTGEIMGDRRDNWSAWPDPEVELPAGGSLAATNDDFTAPRVQRRVVGLPLSQLAAIYAEYDAENDEQKVAAVMTAIGNQLP